MGVEPPDATILPPVAMEELIIICGLRSWNQRRIVNPSGKRGLIVRNAATVCAFALGGGDREQAEGRRSSQQREAPFIGSRRYYRGRIVERLRTLPPGESAALSDLGAAIKDAYTEHDEPWLAELLAELEGDGLVEVDDGRASLP